MANISLSSLVKLRGLSDEITFAILTSSAALSVAASLSDAFVSLTDVSVVEAVVFAVEVTVTADAAAAVSVIAVCNAETVSVIGSSASVVTVVVSAAVFKAVVGAVVVCSVVSFDEASPEIAIEADVSVVVISADFFSLLHPAKSITQAKII